MKECEESAKKNATQETYSLLCSIVVFLICRKCGVMCISDRIFSLIPSHKRQGQANAAAEGVLPMWA